MTTNLDNVKLISVIVHMQAGRDYYIDAGFLKPVPYTTQPVSPTMTTAVPPGDLTILIVVVSSAVGGLVILLLIVMIIPVW